MPTWAIVLGAVYAISGVAYGVTDIWQFENHLAQWFGDAPDHRLTDLLLTGILGACSGPFLVIAEWLSPCPVCGGRHHAFAWPERP